MYSLYFAAGGFDIRVTAQFADNYRPYVSLVLFDDKNCTYKHTHTHTQIQINKNNYSIVAQLHSLSVC